MTDNTDIGDFRVTRCSPQQIRAAAATVRANALGPDDERELMLALGLTTEPRTKGAKR